MQNFSWTCPFCKVMATVSRENYHSDYTALSIPNADGDRIVENIIIVCPNPECKKFTLKANLYSAIYASGHYNSYKKNELLQEWDLMPQFSSMTLPDYIPAAVKEDYYEACLISKLSPKASATLSRRCLQGMIRDYWNVSKKTLHEEILGIQDKIDPLALDAINAVRKIGNIGAHMEKDINSIVEVDPSEAQLLIGLIEILMKEWYITRYEREQRMRELISLAESKK